MTEDYAKKTHICVNEVSTLKCQQCQQTHQNLKTTITMKPRNYEKNDSQKIL